MFVRPEILPSFMSSRLYPPFAQCPCQIPGEYFVSSSRPLMTSDSLLCSNNDGLLNSGFDYIILSMADEKD
jgi:hypothetical protein